MKPHTAAHRPDGIVPTAQEPVVDLRLLARRRVVAQHPHRFAGDLLLEAAGDVTPQRRLRGRKSVVVTQALVDGRDLHLAEPALDELVMRFDLRPGALAERRVDELGEPPLDEACPLLCPERRAAGEHAGRDGRGGVLADRLRVDPERRAELADAAAGVPVLQQLHDVDHSDRSPCHVPLLASTTRRDAQRTVGRSGGSPSHQGIP